MKKRVLGLAAVAALAVTAAGCTMGTESTGETTANITEDTAAETIATTSSAAETTEAETTESTTEETTTSEDRKEEETTGEDDSKDDEATEADNKETTDEGNDSDDSGDAAESGSDTFSGISSYYNIVVHKPKDGYSHAGGSKAEYEASRATYEYEILDNFSAHKIEAFLEDLAAELDDPTTGRQGELLYVTGKLGDQDVCHVFKNIGAGSDLSCYGGVNIWSFDGASLDDAQELLSDEYVDFEAK